MDIRFTVSALQMFWLGCVVHIEHVSSWKQHPSTPHIVQCLASGHAHHPLDELNIHVRCIAESVDLVQGRRLSVFDCSIF